MTDDADVERLQRELGRQGFGPLNDTIDLIASRLAAGVSYLADTLSQAAREHPLTALLLAGQVGYLLARAGRYHAHR